MSVIDLSRFRHDVLMFHPAVRNVRPRIGLVLGLIAFGCANASNDGPNGTGYLLTNNYRAILDYNCSNFYAISVGVLADAIAGR